MLRGHCPYIEHSSDRIKHDVDVSMAQRFNRSTRESGLRAEQLHDLQKSHELLAAHIQRSV